MSLGHKKEWNEFLADLLKSKFKGAPTEAELVDRLEAMMTRRNEFAIRAASSAKLIDDRGGKFSKDRFWEKGAIYQLADIQMPNPTGPAGMDEAGLWRPDHCNREK